MSLFERHELATIESSVVMIMETAMAADTTEETALLRYGSMMVAMDVGDDGQLPDDWKPDEFQRGFIEHIFDCGMKVYRESLVGIPEGENVDGVARVVNEINVMASCRRKCMMEVK